MAVESIDLAAFVHCPMDLWWNRCAFHFSDFLPKPLTYKDL